MEYYDSVCFLLVVFTSRCTGKFYIYHTVRPGKRSLLKTLWEKVKMLVTSIFSFFHNVFYPSKTNLNFSVTFILSYANTFNISQPVVCCLVKSYSTSLKHFTY